MNAGRAFIRHDKNIVQCDSFNESPKSKEFGGAFTFLRSLDNFLLFRFFVCGETFVKARHFLMLDNCIGIHPVGLSDHIISY